jgi:Rrf2 family nitric oxide-sensitive transcriptional repressor
MQLTLYTDYALRVLMYLATHPDTKTTVDELAEHFHISRNHLVKVVHRLGCLGYIASKRGRGGGIVLAHPPHKVRVGQVIGAIENMRLAQCFDARRDACRLTACCALKHALQLAGHTFFHTLDQWTLRDLIVPPAKKPDVN